MAKNTEKEKEDMTTQDYLVINIIPSYQLMQNGLRFRIVKLKPTSLLRLSIFIFFLFAPKTTNDSNNKLCAKHLWVH